MNAPLVPAPRQHWRMGITIAAFGLLFVVLVQRLHHLQVNRAGAFRARAQATGRASLQIPAARGSILDRRGRSLVSSAARWNLFADPSYMQDKLGATVHLSRILELPRATLRAWFESGRNGRLIARNIDDVQAEAIRELGIDHIYLRRCYQRIYPHGRLAAQVLGFVSDEGHGGGGVELTCDTALAGTPGEVPVKRDAVGRPMIDAQARATPARPGCHVQLTIDVAIQRQLERRLLAALEHHQAAGAHGIVVAPTTGEVLAMASLPSFDPADFAADYAENRSYFQNGCLQFVYECGSTIKPLVAGAVVSDGLVDWNTMVDCENGRWLARVGRHRRLVSDSHGYHRLSVAQGVAKSVNVLMSKITLRMPVQRLRDWILRFGFGTQTGIALPGEDAGMLTPADAWTRSGTLLSVCKGYEIGVTPLQMAMAHAAVANGGVMRAPRIVRRIYAIDPENGARIDRPVPALAPPRRIFEPAEAAAIRTAMNMTMTEGTGRRVQLDGYSSAGKTGTTEKLVDGRYRSDRHIASFVCWAPAAPGIDPALLCLVVVDDPRANGHYGGQVAAPVVHDVLASALDYAQVPPDLPVGDN